MSIGLRSMFVVCWWLFGVGGLTVVVYSCVIVVYVVLFVVGVRFVVGRWLFFC